MTVQQIHGADISRWQGEVTAEEIKAAKLHWLYAKATEGVSVIDPKYKDHRAASAKAGVPFGAYHFAHPSSDARRSAEVFLKVADPKPGDMRPMLDFEHATFKTWTVAKRSAWVKTWVDIVRKETGQDPLIYCTMDLNSDMGCALWVARYNDDNRAPRVPAPWKTWTIWQFSDGQDGTPKRVAGLGNVDLNVMNGDPTRLTKIFRLPKPVVVATKPPTKPTPKPVAKKPRRLQFAVAPLQFNDNDKQTTADLKKIFSRGYDVVFGTESGPGSNTIPLLNKEAELAGYYLSQNSRYDTWVAVRKSIIKKGTWKTGSEHAIDRSSRQPKEHVSGHWGDKALVWGKGEIPGVGVCAFGSVHPLTWGATTDWLKNKTDDDQMEVCAAWVKKHGAGTALTFVGGDFNRVDKKYDLTRGKWDGESCWDALGKWDNTGHGNIDAVIRSKADIRTKWVMATALDDKELFLNTDHFLTECTIEVKAL